MILKYGIIIVPTKVMTAKLTRTTKPISAQVCPECCTQEHDADAVFCKFCGAEL
jgi:voltage-gated potassium channel